MATVQQERAATTDNIAENFILAAEIGADQRPVDGRLVGDVAHLGADEREIGGLRTDRRPHEC